MRRSVLRYPSILLLYKICQTETCQLLYKTIRLSCLWPSSNHLPSEIKFLETESLIHPNCILFRSVIFEKLPENLNKNKISRKQFSLRRNRTEQTIHDNKCSSHFYLKTSDWQLFEKIRTSVRPFKIRGVGANFTVFFFFFDSKICLKISSETQIINKTTNIFLQGHQRSYTFLRLLHSLPCGEF